jgi:DNA-binding MarR family transcriptional regulator
MLKRLFTSNTRIKLLTVFLLNPESEFFIRELTRKLEEQINSVRRELDNLKKMGLLKTKSRNRKKYYMVNKNFVAFHELKSIIMKAMSDKENIARKIMSFGTLDVIILSGMFVDKDSPIDLLMVGDVERRSLEHYFTNELETKRPVRFSIMAKEEFLYRRKCKDRFLNDIIEDRDNIVALNKLEKSSEEVQI